MEVWAFVPVKGKDIDILCISQPCFLPAAVNALYEIGYVFPCPFFITRQTTIIPSKRGPYVPLAEIDICQAYEITSCVLVV